MIFKRFLEFFPEIAEQETRRITLLNNPEIPDGQYAFVDSYCADKDCDCRYAYFGVFQIDPGYASIYAATISYGWENLDFYLSWSQYLPSGMAAEMKGARLERSQPQSRYAERFLEFFESKFLVDPAYVDRIKRHYALFKAHLGGKAIRRIYKDHDKNGPCPCGSGKKLKNCCLA